MSRYKITTHRFVDDVEFDSPPAPDGSEWALVDVSLLIDDLDSDLGDPGRRAVVTWELRAQAHASEGRAPWSDPMAGCLVDDASYFDWGIQCCTDPVEFDWRFKGAALADRARVSIPVALIARAAALIPRWASGPWIRDRAAASSWAVSHRAVDGREWLSFSWTQDATPLTASVPKDLVDECIRCFQRDGIPPFRRDA